MSLRYTCDVDSVRARRAKFDEIEGVGPIASYANGASALAVALPQKDNFVGELDLTGSAKLSLTLPTAKTGRRFTLVLTALQVGDLELLVDSSSGIRAMTVVSGAQQTTTSTSGLLFGSTEPAGQVFEAVAIGVNWYVTLLTGATAHPTIL
jgi:hypothetical protein